MPIANYQNPGVYVTQGPSPIVTAVSESALNILFVGYSQNAPTNTFTDVYQYTSTSGVQTFTLTQSGTITNGVLSNNVTGYVLVSGIDYSGFVTTSGVTTVTTISGSSNLVAGTTWVAANYTYTTVQPGTIYSFTDYNSAQNLFGAPFTYTGATPTINSACSLAAFLAFQNNAPLVSLVNIVSSGVAPGNPADYLTFIQGLAGQEGIDVIVPLIYDTSYNSGPTGPLFKGIQLFLDAQANNGFFQRAFFGMDSSVTNLTSVCQYITGDTYDTRITLVAPNQIIYNPGFNSTTGLSTGTLNIDGIYLAAAVAGCFTGQPDVYVPITNKSINGISGIPNQVDVNTSNTLQSYGTTVVRQNRNGQLYVRQGLTTNTQNWVTQELSINAIGDRLANLFETNLSNSNLIGSPITPVTMGTIHSEVLAILTFAENRNIIQGYTGLTIQQNPNNLTEVDVTLQYSPTYSLNYIRVTISINTSTGAISVV